MLLINWRRDLAGALLILACAISAAWALVFAAQASGKPIADIQLFVIGVLRAGTWLSFLLALLDRAGVSRWVVGIVLSIWLAALVAGVVSPSSTGLGGLVIVLCGLFLIEQLYRNTPRESRHVWNALALGLGGMFVYDLVLYSQAVAFGVFDSATWSARGAVNILFVPLIAMTARRIPESGFDIFVSRHIVFYFTSVASVGIYLALMAAGSYLLIIYGGTWGELARVVFVAAGTVVLLVLLVSERVRAYLKVFINKHFFRNKYDYREEWLRLISTMAGFDDGSAREVVIRAMAQIVGSQGGWLWAVDDRDGEYRLLASFRVPDLIQAIDAQDPIIAFINRSGWLIDLEEYRHEPQLYGDLVLSDWAGKTENAWLIVPLMFRQKLLGLVMLTKAPALFDLNYEDRDLLKTVGNHLAVHLAQEQSDTRLAEAQQFEAYNRLTAFLMHDLNNLIAQQSLIIQNAEKHKRKPEFVDDAIRTIANSVSRMKRVMSRLRRRDATGQVRPTELRFLVSAAADRCAEYEPVPVLDPGPPGLRIEFDAEQFTTVLSHLIKNAQDATPPDGTVSVRVVERNNRVAVEIQDSGCGMSAKFIREHLFKPFDSTKGSQGMGIGAYQAREFVRSIGGELSVESEESRGTKVTLTVPLA